MRSTKIRKALRVRSRIVAKIQLSIFIIIIIIIITLMVMPQQNWRDKIKYLQGKDKDRGG